MHRMQATTKDASGWYLAASTQGSHSVLIPIPFNDFTLTDDDPKVGKTLTHTVGAKSPEGLKFSATEMPIIEGRSPGDLAALPQKFRESGQIVADVDTSSFAGYPSVVFSMKGKSTGGYARYVRTPKKLFVVILEYPLHQSKAADEIKFTFLSSLKINTIEQTGAGQPATRPVDKPEGGDKPQPEAERRCP